MISRMDLRILYIYIFSFALHFKYFNLICSAIIFCLNLTIFSINFRYLEKCNLYGKRKLKKKKILLRYILYLWILDYGKFVGIIKKFDYSYIILLEVQLAAFISQMDLYKEN